MKNDIVNQMTKFTKEDFAARFAPLEQKRETPLKIGIVSDTHGSAFAVERALDKLNGVDALLHLGDVADDAAAMSRRAPDVPCAWVRGNCDPFFAAPQELTLTIGGVKILMVHGHEDGVKYDLMNLYYHALECGARVALYGHTHVSNIDRQGNVWLVNPGSAARPRMGRAPSCALLEIENGKAYPGVVLL